MLEAKKKLYDKSGPNVVKALRSRYFEAYYCSTGAEAVEKVLELIPTEAEVGWGGSMTVDALGIKEALYSRGQKMLDRDRVPPEKRWETMRRTLTSDVFLMSSNAVTEDGQLFNIDGNGNRVGALCFGPDSVVVVVGMNKVVPDLAAAYARVRHLAAPANAQRFDITTPCGVNGQCADCKSPQSICASMVATRLCKPTGRIKVVLVGEDLGF
ncbi:MAG: lactate utilization protein [Ruminococcaceae bacterium]|jgi:L-lactate utilization protein LutB|nr:lactate utilization protein [Oscillospiraceae bacterium]